MQPAQTNSDSTCSSSGEASSGEPSPPSKRTSAQIEVLATTFAQQHADEAGLRPSTKEFKPTSRVMSFDLDSQHTDTTNPETELAESQLGSFQPGSVVTSRRPSMSEDTSSVLDQSIDLPQLKSSAPVFKPTLKTAAPSFKPAQAAPALAGK